MIPVAHNVRLLIVIVALVALVRLVSSITTASYFAQHAEIFFVSDQPYHLLFVA